MTSNDADEVVDKMVATMTRAAGKMAKLKKKHAKLMVQQGEASDRVDRVSDFIEAGDTIDVGEQTGADDNEQMDDDIVGQLEAILDANAADEERPSRGAGSSTDRICPASAPAAAPADGDTDKLVCPDCGKVAKNKRGLVSHKRHCPGPGRVREGEAVTDGATS